MPVKPGIPGKWKVDLAGIEPASESLSLEASPITVILLTFPYTTAGWQADVLSSFMNLLLSQSFESKGPCKVDAGFPGSRWPGADKLQLGS